VRSNNAEIFPRVDKMVDKASCPRHRKSPHSLLDKKSGTSYIEIRILPATALATSPQTCDLQLEE
jgi:hypothetical protein